MTTKWLSDKEIYCAIWKILRFWLRVYALQLLIPMQLEVLKIWDQLYVEFRRVTSTQRLFQVKSELKFYFHFQTIIYHHQLIMNQRISMTLRLLIHVHDILSKCITHKSRQWLSADGRADKNPYPHDHRADKDSYLHDSNNRCIILRLQLFFVMINVQLMLV